MLKNYLLFTLSFIFFFQTVHSQVASQERHAIDLGYGGVYLGSGDLFGQGVDLEYRYSIAPSFAIAPRIVLASADKPSFLSFYDKTESLTVDLNVVLTPSRSYDWFSITIGPSIRALKNEQEDFSGLRKSEEVTLGLATALRYRVFSAGPVCMGTKATMQAFYGNGDIVWMLSGYVGLNL